MELVFVGVNMLFLLDKSDLCDSKAVFSRCFESEFFGCQLVDSRNGECAHERCKTTGEFKRDIGKEVCAEMHFRDKHGRDYGHPEVKQLTERRDCRVREYAHILML